MHTCIKVLSVFSSMEYIQGYFTLSFLSRKKKIDLFWHSNYIGQRWLRYIWEIIAGVKHTLLKLQFQQYYFKEPREFNILFFHMTIILAFTLPISLCLHRNLFVSLSLEEYYSCCRKALFENCTLVLTDEVRGHSICDKLAFMGRNKLVFRNRWPWFIFFLH